MAEMTEAQRRAYEAALGRAQQRQQQREAVPTQRLRTAAQGLTLGTADELEARAVSLATGRPYAEVLDEVRGKLKAYQEARPGEALASEIGGAALTALIPGGGPATLGRLATRGAIEGGIYGFGTGEGGFTERAARVPGGAAGGAAGSVVAGTAMRAAGGAINTLTDATRRLVGRRGSSIVENEIQRLAEQTGRTADQIADDILAGRIMAENETIKAAVRSLRSGGGEASRVIEEALTRRAPQQRAAAMTEMRRGLSDVAEPSALQAQRRSDEAVRAAERQAYSQFETMPAPESVTSELADTLRRVPSASKEVEIALRADTGQSPFFKINDDGAVEFTRTPTVAEAERVRRAVANRATALYRESMGGAGEAVAGVERGLRDILDMDIPELATVRGQAAAIRASRGAFEDGRKALAGDVNEKLADFSKLTDPQEIAAYRAGLMAAIEARAATGSRQSMFRNLANEETKEGRILREVFPQDQLDTVINAVENARSSEAARQFVMGGSPTAETLMEAQRRGMGINISDIQGALSGDPTAIFSIARGIADRFGRDLSDAERARVARVLVSEDADLVRRAIQDQGALAALQQRVQQIMAGATRGAGRAGAVGGAQPGAELSGEIGRGLLAQ